MNNLDMAFPPPHPFMFQSDDQNPPHHLFHHGGAPFMMKRSMSLSGIEKSEEGHEDDELSDDGSHMRENKKRLNLEQVKALEKSFELGNKLEPDRKMQLAKALGLQPRQVAIWFQNRRARWKTKQLERDYEILKKQFDSLKANNDSLHAQNKKLSAEVMALKNKESNEVSFKKLDNEGSWSNGSDNSCDMKLDISRTSQLSSRQFFPSSIRPTATSMTQLLHGSSRPEIANQVGQEENNFCNMFSGMEEQQGFWPWPTEQQSYH